MELARTFLRREALRGTDSALAPECYLNAWARVPGNARLRRLAGERGSGLKLLASRLREALLVAGQSGYELIGGAASRPAWKYMVVSWGRNADFAADGSYTDRYFRMAARAAPATLWFVIALDAVDPARLEPNVAVFRRSLATPRLDLRYLLSAAAAAAAGTQPRVHGSVPRLSATVAFADQVTRTVAGLLAQGSFDSIAMPYEAQPFQHALFRAAKLQNDAIRTVGYLHSALPPLPTDLLRRPGAPQLLLVHGSDHAQMLERDLGWPAGSVRRISSLRYRAGAAAELDGLIFLPYHFAHERTIANAFREFIAGSPAHSLPPLAVRNHPVMQGSAAHARLQASMEAAMRAHADRFDPARRKDSGAGRGVSVFIGATAAILEALERGVDAIHICSQPLLESHSAALWRELKVEQLGSHTFRYRLKQRGAYIEFGGDNDSIEDYLRV